MEGVPLMSEFISSIDFSPFFISIKTGVLATIIAFFIGIATARKVMNMGKKARWVVDSIITLPLVLPPTVSGFFLLLLFSLRRPFGNFLYLNFDIKIVQTWAGCVIAAFVIAFPLMYRNARAAFELVDVTMIYAARTLGLSEFKIFWKLILPLAGPGIVSGTILTFARAIGEYGATSMLAGNILGKTRTMSVAIAAEVAGGNYDVAGLWVVIILTLSFLMILSINMLTGRDNSSIKRWG